MTGLVFSPEADEFLARVDDDPLRQKLAARLNSALDRLESDPGQAANRRRRFSSLGLWGIPVVCDDEEWLILWEPLDEATTIVHHIVPAP